MKKLIIILTVLLSVAACKKGEDFRPNKFPGFTGSGNQATWAVFRHNVLDAAYLTATLPTLTPPTTFAQFDSTYKASYAKEVSPFSIRLYTDGSIGQIASSGGNQFAWVKQSNLKWETAENGLLISQNKGGTWTPVGGAFTDQDKLLIKYWRAYFGDTSADKEKVVLDVYYVIFN